MINAVNCKVSFIIPTLNSSRTIGGCLDSIANQDYPRELMEVVIVDGGSSDKTLEIAEEFKRKNQGIASRLLNNPLKTGEAGKAIGIDAASGAILAFVDSDNILVGEDWLKKMLLPFQDKEIFASEVLRWEYNENDSVIDRYCALTGINDPVCLFLGNYDRWSYLTSRWTGLRVRSEIDSGEYLKVVLDKDNIPTMGANGFLIRKDVLRDVDYRPYYFDIDIIPELAKMGFVTLARPKVGIRHYFSDSVATFMRKQNRRIRDYLYFKSKRLRTFKYKIKSIGFMKFIVYTLLIFPLFIQSGKGFVKKRDWAWFFHPVACWLTLIVYSAAAIRSFVAPCILNRKKWGQ